MVFEDWIGKSEFVDVLLLSCFDSTDAFFYSIFINNRGEIVNRITNGVPHSVNDSARLANSMTHRDIFFALDFFCKGMARQNFLLSQLLHGKGVYRFLG